MDENQREELEALCVAYLTQHLKDFPNGVGLDYFEKTFPDKMDEPRDWYQRLKQPSVLAALQSIPNSVKLTCRGNNVYHVSLNKASDKVDQHLVDLVSNQRASSKKKKPALGGYRSQSQRVADSFSLNRRSSNAHDANITNRFRSKFESQPRQIGYVSANRSSTYSHDNSHYHNRSTLHQGRQTRVAPNDPRAAPTELRTIDPRAVPKDQRTSRDWQGTSLELKAAHAAVSSQVRPMSSSSSSSATPSKQPHPPHPPRTPTTSSSSRHHIPTPTTKSSKSTLGDEVNAILKEKKCELRERLYELLTQKFDSLKIFYLASIYKEEYKTELEPSLYGHKTMTDLVRDPYLKDYIEFIPDHPYNQIRAIIGGESKENISSRGGNTSATSGVKNNEPLVERPSILSESKSRYNAIDPFNVRTMLNSLEPLKDIKPVLGNLPIEDVIKYRTMRIIIKEPDMTLRLEDWERKYQMEWNTKIKIRVQDYGCKNLVEFFNKLHCEIPIIELCLVNGEWYAKTSLEKTSKWINTTLDAGKYRAIIVKSKRYDQVAYPGETYPSFDLKSLANQDYYPVTIMSVNYPHKMWLQMKTRESITALLSIETSLTSYEDYKRKDHFPVPIQFIKIGFPCVVYDDQQQRWCRAAIADVLDKLSEDPTVLVFLIDYGVTKQAKKSELQCILKSHLIQPVGLIYAQLYGVSKSFEKMAKITLREFTNPPVLLACKIISSDITPQDDVDIRWQSRKSIFNVTLIDTRQGRDCDLATAINNCTSTAEDVD